MYCKLINGVPHRMSMPIKTQSGLYFGNNEEAIRNAGYKRLVCEEKPVASGFYAVPFWVEADDCIMQCWRLQKEEEATE